MQCPHCGDNLKAEEKRCPACRRPLPAGEGQGAAPEQRPSRGPFIAALVVVVLAGVLSSRLALFHWPNTLPTSNPPVIDAHRPPAADPRVEVVAPGAESNNADAPNDTPGAAGAIPQYDPQHPAVKLTEDPEQANAAGQPSSEPSIFLAVLQQDIATVKRRLAAQPQEAKARNLKGATPLHLAAAVGDETLVRVLLDAKASANAKCNQSWLAGQTPLHIAAGQGHLKTMRLLVDRGAIVHARDDFGTTALHEAAIQGQRAAAAFLLEHGAEIDAPEDVGYTPLCWAITSGKPDIVRFFVEKGADINIKTDDYTTPLSFARSMINPKDAKTVKDREAIVEYLRERGAED